MAFESLQFLLTVFSILLLVCVSLYYMSKSARLQKLIEQLQFDLKSCQVKYGKAWEKFVPFMKSFPYNPNDFKFIGEPIDGIVFDPNKIVFLEVKTGKSQLSQKQKNVKELVEKKKVEWEEIRY